MKKLSGFSLMEMMVVLLIVSIVAAATAPMINKKMLLNASESSPWIWTGNGHNIAYNLAPSIQTASIGAINPPGSASNPRLYINTALSDGGYLPQIAFGTGESDTIKLISANNNIWLSSEDTSFADTTDSVVIGASASAAGSNLTALGSSSIAGNNSTAIGYNANAATVNSVAIGNSANVSASGDIAIGNAAQTTGASATESAVAIGQNSSAGNDSVAIGRLARATGTSAIAIGSFGGLGNVSVNVTASGTHSIAMGDGTQSTNSHTVAIGDSAKAVSSNALAMGYSANAASNNSLAIGTNALANNSAVGSIAFGSSANARASSALAIGSSSNATGVSSIALGALAMVTSGNSSISIGSGSNISADNSIAIGRSANARAANSIAIGNGANVSGANSIAIGHNVMVTNSNTIVLGDANSTVYIPGNLVVGGSTYLGVDQPATSGDAYSYLYLKMHKLVRISEREGSDNKLRHDDKDYDYPKSDRRLKNVGKAFTGGLDKIKKLEVFNYTFKDDKSKTPRVGVMAQDLQKIFPDAVIKGEDGFLRIRMEDMFYALVNAVKELDSKIESLKNKDIAELKTKVTTLEKENAELKKQNAEFATRLKVLEQKIK